MEITGKIVWCGDLKSGISKKTGQQWAMQDYCIESEYTTPTGVMRQNLAFTVMGQDKLAEYALRVGDICTVMYGINAREFEGKWYNDVRAYKVVKEGAGFMAAPQPQAQPKPQPQAAPQQAQQMSQQQQQSVQALKDAFAAEEIDPDSEKLPF